MMVLGDYLASVRAPRSRYARHSSQAKDTSTVQEVQHYTVIPCFIIYV